MNTVDSEIIDNLGGTGFVAKLCGVTDGAVSQWRQKRIPDAQRAFLSLYVSLSASKRKEILRERGLLD